jgi:hypothetical protein
LEAVFFDFVSAFTAFFEDFFAVSFLSSFFFDAAVFALLLEDVFFGAASDFTFLVDAFPFF